jgi:MYXO-CTERM domain-containing protein
MHPRPEGRKARVSARPLARYKKTMRSWVLGAMLGTVLMVGCSQVKADAVEAAAEVRKLCKAKKNDEAGKLGVEQYEINEVFREAVDSSAVTWKIKDVSIYDYCGPGFIEASRKMSEHSETDDCSCEVVGGAPRGDRTGYLALGLVALAWRRRRATAKDR